MSKKIIASRLKDLAQATDYAQWREVALELDRLEGAEAWKLDETSDQYDYLLIRERLELMRDLRRIGNVRELTFHLAEGLHGNLANISNPLLHGSCRVGTKRLIEEYVDEVARCLDYICVGEFSDYSHDEKVLFFKRTGASFGRSALLLSGGATLGMFHLGVIKALFQANLLPRVISGSSAGSIIAAMTCTRSDVQLADMFEPGNINLAAFQRVSFIKMFKGSTLMDSGHLAACLNANIGEESFVQAFEHAAHSGHYRFAGRAQPAAATAELPHRAECAGEEGGAGQLRDSRCVRPGDAGGTRLRWPGGAAHAEQALGGWLAGQ